MTVYGSADQSDIKGCIAHADRGDEKLNSRITRIEETLGIQAKADDSQNDGLQADDPQDKISKLEAENFNLWTVISELQEALLAINKSMAELRDTQQKRNDYSAPPQWWPRMKDEKK